MRLILSRLYKRCSGSIEKTSIRYNNSTFQDRCYSVKSRLNIKSVIDRLEYHKRNCLFRGVSQDVLTELIRIHQELKQMNSSSSLLNAKRKQLATKEIHADKAMSDRKSAAMELREQIDDIKNDLRKRAIAFEELASRLPNDTSILEQLDDAKFPLDSFGNAIISQFGPSINPLIDSCKNQKKPMDTSMVDLYSGSNSATTGFYYLKNEAALLELALVNYAVSCALKEGYRLIIPPDVVRSEFVHGAGYAPRRRKDEESSSSSSSPLSVQDVFELQWKSPSLVLAGTSELALLGLFADRVVDFDSSEFTNDLPIQNNPCRRIKEFNKSRRGQHKLVAVSHCFRPEVGHGGSMKSGGLFRVRQFTKVELFIIKDNDLDSSRKALDDLIGLQQKILGSLHANLSLRALHIRNGLDFGMAAFDKYDHEMWMDNRWVEVTSASNCTDYQSRRLGIRYRCKDELKFAHTLNGTAMAVPRIIQAILEHCRLSNGSIDIPSVLEPFYLHASSSAS